MNIVQEIERLQKELDRRTEIENKAVELISNCDFENAIKLLKTLDDSFIETYRIIN